jgi:hypothetical protein
MDTPFIVPVVLFISMAAAFILRGPLGKALADRIAGRPPSGAMGDADRVLSELDDLRHRLTELEERVDFSERLLARGRETGRVGPGA